MKKNMLAASAIALSALISGCSTNDPVPSPSSAVSSPVASESHQDAPKATPSESTDAIASSYDCPAALTPMPSDDDVHGYAVASDGQIRSQPMRRPRAFSAARIRLMSYRWLMHTPVFPCMMI